MTQNELSEATCLEILVKAEANQLWIYSNYAYLIKNYAKMFVCVHNEEIVSVADKIEQLGGCDEPDAVCEYILPRGTAMLLSQ